MGQKREYTLYTRLRKGEVKQKQGTIKVLKSYLSVFRLVHLKKIKYYKYNIEKYENIENVWLNRKITKRPGDRLPLGNGRGKAKKLIKYIYLKKLRGCLHGIKLTILK